MSTLRVYNIENPSTAAGGIGIATDGSVTVGGLQQPTEGPLSNRNLIINGAMQVAQRATSVTGSSASGSYLTVDRFANHGSGATFDSSQETVTAGGMTGLPVKFKNYHKFNVTTGANNCGLWQCIEDVRTVQGEHTFSFYARGTNPSGGTLEIDTRQDFGSGGSSSVDGVIGSFSLTDTWQRFTFTFTPSSLTGKTIGTSSYFRIFVRQPDADNSTDAWHIDITGVQFEEGSKATPYEHRSFHDEQLRCLRYYQRFDGALASGSGTDDGFITLALYTATAAYGGQKFIVPMRARPTMAAAGCSFFSNNSTDDSLTVDLIGASYNYGEIRVTSISRTAGHAGWLRIDQANAYIEFNAEL